MRCPKCNTEYASGLPQCPVCSHGLVAPARKAAESKHEMVELLKTTDVALLMVVKSLLESAEIPHVVQGEEGLHFLPLSHSGGFFNTSAYGAVIRVPCEFFSDARQLLDEKVTSIEGDD